MKNNECQRIRDKLQRIYGKSVLCRIGSGDPVYNATTQDYSNASIAVYIHKERCIAIVWNLDRRRKKGRMVKSLSVTKNWDELAVEHGCMKAIYKKMGTDSAAPYEKVLCMDLATLDDVADRLNLYIKMNPDDIEFPDSKEVYKKDSDYLPKEVRGKVSTQRWDRDRRFRSVVLGMYGGRCAICRCDEEKLLQAAHIVAVADDGTDEAQNGICLCANHHIMFDKGLIDIDFEQYRIKRINENIKKMPWYTVFQETYGGRLLQPNMMG